MKIVATSPSFSRNRNLQNEIFKYFPDAVLNTDGKKFSQDELIEQHKLREAVVVYSEAVAAEKGLEIDNDDSHAADPARRNQSFALLIHGVQPKGSEAAAALKILKRKAKEEANV